MFSRINIQVGIVFSLLFFTAIAFFVPAFPSNNQIEVLLGATTFIYGIIIAFYISFSTSRLTEMSQILNSEDSIFVSIYRTTKVFGEDKQKKVQSLLDDLLTSSIDFYLNDYHKTVDKFEDLSNYVLALNPVSNAQQQAYSTLLGLIQQSQQNRTRISSLTRQRLFFYEWLVLFVLNSVVIFCIFYLNNHSLISMIISVLLATSTVTLLFILRDLAYLKWKEQYWIWESLKQTFNEIGLPAYYPVKVIKFRRAISKKGEKIRVAHYPHDYPNFDDKEIKEIVVE